MFVSSTATQPAHYRHLRARLGTAGSVSGNFWNNGYRSESRRRRVELCKGEGGVPSFRPILPLQQLGRAPASALLGQDCSCRTFRRTPVEHLSAVSFFSSGPTDLSMKSLSSANLSNSASSMSTSNALSGRGNGGGGGASTQLSQPEVTAVRQLIAGYRESAAFLMRSADELENLILQQN